MYLTEPNHTAYDLHFRLFGVPVRVHPLFWLVSFIFGFNANDPTSVLIWMIAVFISILIHEMGHALVIRWYGWAPSVVLYSLGGLAIHNPYLNDYSSAGKFRRNRYTQILISLAGPMAGFAFAAFVAFSSGITGIASFEIDIVQGLGIPFVFTEAGPKPANEYILMLIGDLMFINIFFGLLNLVPVWPLDGGKVARELFLMWDRSVPVRNSLVLSMICAGGVAFWGMKNHMGFLGIMFLLMAISNYQDMNGSNRYGGGNPW